MTNILHIDTELTWRGGENQVRLLIENTQGKDIKHHVTCDPRSVGAKRFSKIADTHLLKYKGLGAFVSAIKLAYWTKKNNIHVLDCQTSKAHTLALLCKLLNPKLKIVVHRRVDFIPGGSFFNKLKYKSSAINSYVAISSAIGKVLEEYGIDRNKIRVVPSAVDKQPFVTTDPLSSRQNIRQALNIDETTPIILCVAYFTHQKGHETLIRALGELHKKNINFSCLLAGEGELKENMELLVRELKIEKKVHFLGIRKDIPVLMKASDILSMPSNFEGLGTTLLDAVYSDLPIVASNIGGIPEIVIDQKTGFLSDVGDFKTHGIRLEQLVGDEKLRRKLSINARAHADKYFSLENMVEGNCRLYKELHS